MNSSERKDSSPRVLVVAGFAPSLVNFRGPLLQALRNAGCAVHAAAPQMKENTDVLEQLNQWGITAHDVQMQRTGMSPIGDFTTLRQLLRLIRRVKPHAVLGYTIKPVIYGMMAARFARVPKRFALITGLGYAFNREATGKRALALGVVRRLYTLALKKTHKVFFQNPDDQALFRELGLLPERVPSRVVNGSGVDIAQFKQVPVPEGPPRFLLIARLLGDKGVREYAAAAEYIKRRYPEVRFQLVGWIDDNPNAIEQDELDNWVKSGTLEYVGRLSDVREVIAECSVYVLPSYREGTPRTVLEAMAIGRAIITTDAPGCRETVVQGENGYLVPVRDTAMLQETMIQFIEQPNLVAEMGQRSREIAEDKYDVHKVNSVMLAEMNLHD